MKRFQTLARLEAPGWLSAVTLALVIATLAVWADILSHIGR